MIYRLPPLNALRVFEAAARHLSFKEAAQELSITQAAVSHQIKSLEEYLGVELFRRAGRGVQLTEAARGCLPKLREGFESLARAGGGGARGAAGPPAGVGRGLGAGRRGGGAGRRGRGGGPAEHRLAASGPRGGRVSCSGGRRAARSEARAARLRLEQDGRRRR